MRAFERTVRMPLIEALLGAIRAGRARFHVPGHKGDSSLLVEIEKLVGADVFRADYTEVEGLDDLHWPSGPIKEAEAMIAEAWGTEESFLLVNGSTVGIHAAVLACATARERGAARPKVIIQRNAHKSVIGAMLLAGAEPHYVMPEMEPVSWTAAGVTPEALRQALTDCPGAAAVLLVHPTYYGIAGDIGALVDVAHGAGVPVIVDEAHGAHLPFHEGLPPSGLKVGADIVVSGAHKTAGALTQAAILHVQGSLVDRERLRAALRVLQSSSPSYILMASLDAARALMVTRGRDLLDRVIRLSEEAREEIGHIPGLRCLSRKDVGRPGFRYLDPTKLTVVLDDEAGFTGLELAGRLEEEGVSVEMAGSRTVLAVLSYADSEDSLNSLVGAIRRSTLDLRRRGHGRCPARRKEYFPSGLPEKVLSPRECFARTSRWVPLDAAVREVSADVVAVYPPGIPLLCPGERVSAEVAEYLKSVIEEGYHVQGIRLDAGTAEMRISNWE